MKLPRPQLFYLLETANEEILRLNTSRKKMYFDGDFNYVHGRIHVYEFEETLRASQASQNDYKGVIKKCTTSDILPNIEGTLVSLALQIVCIPKADIEKAMEQAAKETAEKAIEILTNTHEPSAKKKIMSPQFCSVMSIT